MDREWFKSVAGASAPPDRGLTGPEFGSFTNAGDERPKLKACLADFSFSSDIFSSQIPLFRKISSTLKCIFGKISETAAKSGMAKMLMKPSCDSPNFTRSSRTGGPPKRHVGICNSLSMTPWLLSSSVSITAHRAAVLNFRACARSVAQIKS